MHPSELESLAAAHVSYQTNQETGEKTISISNEGVSLSPYHAKQLDQLVGKLVEKDLLKDKPILTKLGASGALQIKAPALVEVIELSKRHGIQLDDPR